MPEPQQVTNKTVQPPNPLDSDLEDIQQYAVNLFVEKLALSLGFAILSALIVFITALVYDVRFMTAFLRAIFAFFVSGFAAALVSNVLDMQEDYYKLRGEADAALAQAAAGQVENPANDQQNQQQQNDQQNQQNQSGQFTPLNAQNLPNAGNNNQR